MYNYVSSGKEVSLPESPEILLSSENLIEAITLSNNAIKELNNATKDFNINIFDILGLRNLSGVVGEYFAKCIELVVDDRLKSNPHQDGYPDLLLNSKKEMKDYYKSIISNASSSIPKELFSPYKYGGIEIKSTCGTTPPANQIAKPLIGEQRIDILTSFDWKAHHTGTNNLIGVLWDFIDGYPVIVAVFYSSDLTSEDWGKIVQPKDGGGRTTSVSIMNSKGIKKMCTNWLAIIDDPKYIDGLAKKKWIGYKVK